MAPNIRLIASFTVFALTESNFLEVDARKIGYDRANYGIAVNLKRGREDSDSEEVGSAPKRGREDSDSEEVGSAPKRSREEAEGRAKLWAEFDQAVAEAGLDATEEDLKAIEGELDGNVEHLPEIRAEFSKTVAALGDIRRQLVETGESADEIQRRSTPTLAKLFGIKARLQSIGSKVTELKFAGIMDKLDGIQAIVADAVGAASDDDVGLLAELDEIQAELTELEESLDHLGQNRASGADLDEIQEHLRATWRRVVYLGPVLAERDENLANEE